jgi:TonB-linked SusC/RagA family outer membrane protein
MPALAQERVVQGRVVSAEDGTSIPGVNVVVKGTTNGTTTDADGNYRLTVPASGGTLVFSFIGLRTEEVAIGDRTTIDASMGVDVTQLSEVVVVGYGTIERNKLSSAVTSVEGGKIAQLATANFADQLAGRAAGVQVGVNTGILGVAPTINIRGVNSMTSGRFPLIVLDGIPMTTGSQSSVTPTNPLADLNPNDIESYEVLKDGAATAIYGSRAANGVILVTTKRGTKSKGQPKVDFAVSTGFSQAVNRFDLANAEEFETIANAKLAAAGQPAAAITDPSVPGSGETDWQDVLLRNGAFSNYNISLAGATESTNYYVSAGYQYQESSIVANLYERLSFRTNADHRINKWLKMGAGINFTRSENNGLNTGSNALSGNLAGGIRAFPNVTVLNDAHPTGYNITADGQALGQGANTRAITSSWTNQAFVLNNNKFIAKTDRLFSNIYLQVDPIEGLALKTYFGIDYLGNKDYQMWDPRHGDGRGSAGIVFNQFRDTPLWNWQNTAAYDKDFGAHGLNVVAGLEYQQQTFESFFGQGTAFSDLFFMQHGLVSGQYTNQFSGGTYSQTGFTSTFGRVNYSFADKYLLSASARRDGISRLAEENRYGTFWGASVGYRVSQEEFFKNSGVASVLNDLKIRASYATVGNVDIGLFPYATAYGAARYGSQNGLGFSQLGNASLQWEKSKKINIGAEMGFLNNRIQFIVDYYQNDIDDNILDVPYPPSLGIPNNQISQNIGLIRNNGLELTINATAMTAGDFAWNISANLTTQKNEVLETFRTSAGAWAEVGVGNYNISARVGESVNVIYGYTFAGVNRENGNPMYMKGDGTIIQRNVGTGVYSVYDPANPTSEATAATLSSLDVSNGGDRSVLGQSLPKWYGGMTNTFTYKGIQLDVFLRYAGGHSIYNQTRQDVMLNMDFTNSSRELLNSWTPENMDSELPKMYFGSNGNAFVNQAGAATTRFLEKGDFLRIQNVVLSYSLPKSVLDMTGKFRINSVKFFGQIQNAAVFTKYKGLDPELSTLANGLATGIDNTTNPLNRIYTLGLNVGF